MPEQNRPVSPRFKARMAGVLYLLSIITGLSAALAGRGHALFANAANLAGAVCYIAVTLLLYAIFKPVNRTLSLLAAIFSLAGCVLLPVDMLKLVTLPFNPMIFFGGYCLLLGYLILRSTFMPHFLGVLMGLAGLGWLTFLSPTFGSHMFRYTMYTGLLGEGALTLWLLLMGVNAERWKHQALRSFQP
jgi:hypothetical protein